MANETIKAEQIVEAAVLLLQREIVLPRLVWRQADANFRGAKDDTITLRVPAVLTARTRTMRSNTALTADEFAETAVPVALTTHAYSLLKVRDEELTLDITNFARQVLAPQIRAVGEAMEDAIATALSAANAADSVDIDASTTPDSGEAFGALVDAAEALNRLNVPRGERVVVVGSGLEAWFLKDPVVNNHNSGNRDALDDATLNRLAGFTIVGSNALDPYEGYAFHRTAIAFANVAPDLPDGAPSKARVALDGLALRYLRDYAPENSTGPVDRTLVDAFVGATSVENDDNINQRLVDLNVTGS